MEGILLRMNLSVQWTIFVGVERKSENIFSIKNIAATKLLYKITMKERPKLLVIELEDKLQSIYTEIDSADSIEDRIIILSKWIKIISDERNDWMTTHPKYCSTYLVFETTVRAELYNQRELLKQQENQQQLEKAVNRYKQFYHLDENCPRESELGFLTEDDRHFLQEIGGVAMIDTEWDVVSKGVVSAGTRAEKFHLLRELDKLWIVSRVYLEGAKNTAEQVYIMREAFQSAQRDSLNSPENKAKQLYCFRTQKALDYYEGVLKLEKEVAFPAPISIDDNMYSRVFEVFNHQTFWAGSFSDFVFTMNELALNGYLKRVEYEEELAKTFLVKQQGKKAPQKITAEKIKKRKRELDNGDLSGKRASPEIRTTVQTILSNMPSQKTGR